MIATLISILLAIATLFYPHDIGIESLPQQFYWLPAVLLLIPILLWGLSFLALQKTEQNMTPRLLELIKSDTWTKLLMAGLIFFPLLAIICGLNPSLHLGLGVNASAIIWILCVGISVDLIFLLLWNILDFLNPFAIVNRFSRVAKSSVEADREVDLCRWTDSLSEIALKALAHNSSSLCHHSVNAMRENLRLFLECSKSIAHETQDKQSTSAGITDKIGYTLFYFLDRLTLIYRKALKMQLEPTCSHIVTTLGKIAVDAANCDISLVTFPVQAIGESSLQAEVEQMDQVAIKGSCTLLEAAKSILNQKNLAYQDLKDPFTSIISQLDAIAKETFRHNKDSNIKILIQPLYDLKAEFQKEPLSTHIDTPIIMTGIDAVIAEWTTLETVLKTMPKPPLSTNEKA